MLRCPKREVSLDLPNLSPVLIVMLPVDGLSGNQMASKKICGGGTTKSTLAPEIQSLLDGLSSSNADHVKT